jgi:hypothetical protein
MASFLRSGRAAARLLPAYLSHTAQIPGSLVPRSVSGSCWIERCSPWPAPFPPPSPPSSAPLRSTGSQVLRRGPTPLNRADLLYAIAFSDRSRSWLGREVPEVSRFSCMLFLSVRGFLDYAEPAGRLRSLRGQLCCPPSIGDEVGVSDLIVFEAQ